MGNFWDNATKEFGKKTGKAIGNKLYGKHADAIRKRVAVSVNNNSATIDYDAIERAKQTTLECEYHLNLLNTILNIDFKAKDVEGIIKNLTFLTSSIDLWLKQSDKKKSMRAARSQFNTGLAMLRAVNAQHPMLPYFISKEQEWQAFASKQKKQNIILYSTLTGLFVAFIVFLIIMANL